MKKGDLSPPTTMTACQRQLIVSVRSLFSTRHSPQVTISLDPKYSCEPQLRDMLNLATVMRRRTARSKSQTSGRVLGSNWEPRMKKRRVSKRIANSFTVLVVRQFAFALGRKRRRRRKSE